MRRALRPLKAQAVRAIRAALTRHARAQPSAAEAAGADRRVIFLITAAWGMGGIIRTTLNLAGHLAARGYEVEILSVGRGRDEPFFGAFPPGVEVVALEDKRRSRTDAGLLERLLRSRSSVLIHPHERAAKGFNLWVDLMLVRRLRGRSGTLITTRPGLNMLAVDLAPPGLRLVGQEHMNLAEHPESIRRAMKRKYGRLDALTVLTEGDRERYERHLEGSVPVVRIPNTVREMGGGSADLTSRTVLAAGRLSPQKGYDLLIRAFAQVADQHPDWRLVIHGEGPKRAMLEGVVADHQLSGAVTLAGPAKDVGREMERASIFVLSSRFEGLPLVLLEAMSKGMAVVSFDCPTGPRDVIDDRRNGLLVPPKRIQQLADAIVELIEDEELRARVAAGAVETARDYSMAAVGPVWEELLRAVRTEAEVHGAAPRSGSGSSVAT